MNNELVLFDMAEAWLRAVVEQLEASTAGIPRDLETHSPYVFVSPEGPPPIDSPNMLATWIQNTGPFTDLDGRPTLVWGATMRCRLRRQLTMPDPNTHQGGLVPPLVKTEDAGIVHADLWAVTRSIPNINGILLEKYPQARLDYRNVQVNALTLAGEASVWGVDADILVPIPESAREC